MMKLAASTFSKLTFLGTSSGTPTLTRNVSSTCLTFQDGSVWLFDCGEGTQHQLLNPACSVSRGKIERIFLTHLHGDHCYGLPGLICSLSLAWSAPGIVPNATIKPRNTAANNKTDPKTQTKGKTDESTCEDDEGAECGPKVHDHFSKRSRFLEIVGPEGTAAFLRSVLLISEAQFGFQYRVKEFRRPTTGTPNIFQDAVIQAFANVRHPDEAEPLFVTHQSISTKGKEDALFSAVVYSSFVNEDANSCATAAGSDDDEQLSLLQVRAVQLDHRVFTVGYVLTEPAAPGTLDMAKAAALGVPKGPLLGKLKNGETVQLPNNGGVVRPEEVVGPSLQGRTLVLLGDTCDSQGVKVLLDNEGIAAVDWISHECTFDEATAHLAVPRGHSTARMAGRFAQSLGPAKKLILTHFSARFPSREKDASAMDGLVAEAQPMCPQTEVITAEDFMNVDLSRKKL